MLLRIDLYKNLLIGTLTINSKYLLFGMCIQFHLSYDIHYWYDNKGNQP